MPHEIDDVYKPSKDTAFNVGACDVPRSVEVDANELSLQTTQLNVNSSTQFGRRAFSVCGPDVWNSLPPSLRTVDSNSSFRRALKTHLFQLAFNN